MSEHEHHSSTSRSARSAHFFNYLHRYRLLLLKRWWVLPLTIALGVAVQAVILWNSAPTFISFARMIMNIKITSATGTGTGTGFIEELSNFMGTQAQLMKSTTVRERAALRVRALKPNLEQVEVKLETSYTPKTTIFNLQAVGGEADYTTAYLDACMEEYTKLKAEMRASTSDTTLARIMEQLKSLEQDLKKYEEEEMAFKATNNVAFITEHVTSVATYLVQKNRQLDMAKSEFQLQTMLSLEQNLEGGGKNPIPAEGDSASSGQAPLIALHDDYRRAQQELQMKKAELQDWSTILKPKHPRIIALNEEISRREKLLTIVKDLGRDQLDRTRNTLGTTITNLEREIKELDVRSLDLSKKLAEYERIRSNKQNVQNLHDNLQRAMQSLGVEKEVNPDSVTPLERATPAMPARGSEVKAYIRAAAFGLVAGLLLLFVIDRLDDRPASFTDLQDTFDEEVMGQIPLEGSKGARRNGVGLLDANDGRHAFLEAYRNLRSSLMYMATEGKRPRVMLVTSAIPGDGKSMTTANLAITMALAGSRVLLVDADLRKGLLHRRFSLEASAGLTEVLTGQRTFEKVILPTSTENLFLLPRGDTCRNPGEMFLKKSTHELIAQLAASYDYVIFDTAPVMAADDVTSLAPHVEGVLFVIRANYTSARVARAALELLYQREVDVLGMVFNGVQTNSGDYYYYRYKDYYSDPKSA